MSDENLLNLLNVNPASLTNRERGNLSELGFMRKAASFGFAVAKPWGEGERYDVILRVDSSCWRVQVKSVVVKSRGKTYYRIKTTGGNTRKRLGTLYTAAEIDFLVAYIFPEDAWYVFPASVVEKRKAVCVTPRSKRSSFEKYREAWGLMKPAPAAVSKTEAPDTGDPGNGALAATAKAGTI